MYLSTNLIGHLSETIKETIKTKILNYRLYIDLIETIVKLVE